MGKWPLQKSRDCPHTNVTTNAKSETFSFVARSDCCCNAKTGATTAQFCNSFENYRVSLRRRAGMFWK